MNKYFRVDFQSGEELYVTAVDMRRILIWILQTRPMTDYYNVNIVEVLPNKKEKKSGDFRINCVPDYYYHVYNTHDDEVVRQNELEWNIDIYKERHHV